MLERLRRSGTAIVYVSHRLAEIFAITDRVVVMRDAQVVHEGPTADLTLQSLIAQITGKREATVERPRPAAAGEEILRVDRLGLTGVVEQVSFSLRSQTGGLTRWRYITPPHSMRPSPFHHGFERIR